MPVTMTLDRSTAVLRRVRELTAKRVLVGIPASADNRDGGEIGNAAIGYINEFGATFEHPGGTPYIRDAITDGKFVGVRFVDRSFPSPDGHTEAHTITIPARPHLVPGVRRAQARTAATMKRAGQAALAGQDPVPQLVAAGLIAEDSVKAVIEEVLGPPLAAATLAQRRAGGFKGTTPLLRTGAYRSAITSVIEDGGVASGRATRDA